jgi:hypothetical protein
MRTTPGEPEAVRVKTTIEKSERALNRYFFINK